MASSNFFSFALLAVVALVSADKPEAEVSITSFLDNLNERFQKVTSTFEDAVGVNVPSTNEEVKAALQGNLDDLQKSAQNIQKQLAAYNVTGKSFSDLWDQIQGQVNATVGDLSKKNPDLGKMLESVKTGYNNLVDVGKRVSDVVQQQTGTTSEDLKTILQKAGTEISKATGQIEAKFQEVVADSQKKSKTS